MIIIQVAGGLGNQLQQYALYQKFVHMGKAARLDLSWFDANATAHLVNRKQLTKREPELTYFDRLQFEVCTGEEREALIGSDSVRGKLRRKLLPGSIHRFTESEIYHPEILGFENMYLCGYFACEKYYADILYDLRNRIQFPQSSNPARQELMTEMKNSEAVSVHVRRGDYLNPENAQMFGNICTEEYYHSAIDYIGMKCENPHFYVFSDDVEYARAHFCGSEYTIVDINHGRDSFYDIQLMSCCRHNICANSTFSFWGARLNPGEDKIMIRPTVHKNSQVFDEKQMKDWWPEWMFIDARGKRYACELL